jgi:hypothetical protein
VNRAGGRSGSLRNIGRIEQWNVGSGAGRTVPAADAERPLSVSKAVALLRKPPFTAASRSARCDFRIAV